MVDKVVQLASVAEGIKKKQASVAEQRGTPC